MTAAAPTPVPEPGPITCLVADDHPAVVQAVAEILASHGIEVARAAHRYAPETGVILYTAYGDRALLTEALDAGARGFVLKEAPLAEVVRAVELVADGRTYVDPVLAGVLSGGAAADTSLKLTQRERDTLRLLAD